jgi:hypothetical protein
MSFVATPDFTRRFLSRIMAARIRAIARTAPITMPAIAPPDRDVFDPRLDGELVLAEGGGVVVSVLELRLELGVAIGVAGGDVSPPT